MNRRFFGLLAACMLSLSHANAQSWPTPLPEAKAGARWWWLGSAVDEQNLKWNIAEYSKHGIGALEITPLYGVQGNQANNIEYLSDRWMQMLRFTQTEGKRNGVEIDMATGTGWPFGGPWVPLKESACKAVFVTYEFDGDNIEGVELIPTEKERKNTFIEKVMAYDADGEATDVTKYFNDGRLTWKAAKKSKWNIVALYIKYGVMRVKRAAPGGEGLVIDHFDRNAVSNYLKHIEAAFERTGTPYPHTFFNDSYEVEAATWTPSLFDEFQKRRGYRLEDHLPALVSIERKTLAASGRETDEALKVLSDYRETLGDLLLENFTEQWTAWAHSHGAITRNQAHGSPANLIDCYSAVDIPEIEGFGLSELGIKGLRQDPGNTRKNDADFTMLKYAPSAAHIGGKRFTSSETFTWLTEHFRTSLSQLKPDIDLMFCAGVNHMFFHGTCYSPKDDVWPGWKFYASIDMSPTNSIWRDASFFMDYVERCQSFLQWGQPDNDFLVFLPVRDMWKQNTGKLLMQFSIHAMGKLAPDFIKTVLSINEAGYDCDYISERLLLSTTYNNGMLQTAAGTRYKGLIIPGSGIMPKNVKAHLEDLKRQGARIVYTTDKGVLSNMARPETMRTTHGLKTIRRKNDNGYHYFIANLSPNDVKANVPLAVDFKDAVWYNPLNGEIFAANVKDGAIEMNLKSGESMILQTYDNALAERPAVRKDGSRGEEIALNGKWNLKFTEEAPDVTKDYTLDRLQTWETLDEQTSITMGTGIYTTHVKMSKKQDPKANWLIDLGDVRESARVYINGEFIGCAWSVPFVLDTKGTLKVGDNEIRIEVTNLPANRISKLDRDGVKWRKMEEINVVDIRYKKTLYDNWEPVKSGLNSEVKLIKSL